MVRATPSAASMSSSETMPTVLASPPADTIMQATWRALRWRGVRLAQSSAVAAVCTRRGSLRHVTGLVTDALRGELEVSHREDQLFHFANLPDLNN